ncbi:PRC-barrel domain-containing protein [Chelativorans salis]|uniref:PRC-barrel domain-containing protein n=1 Tax=Chelativorans salis TaxID=2978478 RepID=A0ABT2LYJ4_9HYPH|nr:PRC-barrel domain-containing protein [Chelativorans sp. EGI FJ00035]MCT7378468.1 PRC-barrel domain-containing protein [Chelativorans sp. EGI FJ00035]
MASKLLISTAVATLLASGAMAQTTTPTAPTEPVPAQPEVEMVVRASGHLASNLIGETVYSGRGDDAQNIGKVNDLVISDDGEVEAIVVGVGGFLGIGQKEVALQYDVAMWAEREGDRWLVVETSADALKALDDFDRSAYRPMPADANIAEPKPATAEEIKAAEEKAAAEAAQAEAEAQPAEPAEE